MPYIRADAASVRANALAPSKWLWLHPRILVTWLAVMVALFLGVLSFAAVREMSIECRGEPSRLLTTEGGNCLALEDAESPSALSPSR